LTDGCVGGEHSYGASMESKIAALLSCFPLFFYEVKA